MRASPTARRPIVTLCRYELKLRRSQAKDSDDDDAAGPLPVISASGKIARVERPKAPVVAAAPAPAQAAPRAKELSADQMYLKQLAQAQDHFESKRGITAESSFITGFAC